MKKHYRILTVVMPMLALALPSCGRHDGPPLYPVRGKVIYQGQPAAGATVVLRRQDPEPNTTPLIPTGQADEEGNFSLAVPDVGAGAPAGKYTVLIQWRTKAGGTGESKPAPKKGRRAVLPDKPDGVPDRLAGRYMDAEKSPFHVEVKPGDNDLGSFGVSK